MRDGSDIRIVGAGVIGLALALELRRRGATVQVQDAGNQGGQASWAAAGMLAAEDPHNPPALRSLALWSRALYPAFLERVAALSGTEVPFQTACTLQYGRNQTMQRLREHSLDPRQLMPALRRAAERAGVEFFASNLKFQQRGLVVLTGGAWSALPGVAPRKGQMLRVAMPPGGTLQYKPLRQVHRSAEVYIVPRTQGPQAGTALIGATVEDAGFDVSTDPEALQRLRARAAALVPALGDEQAFPAVEAWAGLRPATPDDLPLLGAFPAEPNGVPPNARRFVAAGHFRNGILLAPATAVAMADVLEGQTPAINLDPYVPDRFSATLAATTFGPSNRYSHVRG